jgi:hypothetical protein
MRQIKTFSDDRLDAMCSYCGEFPNTRDHVPSKILLDNPYPENLPIVPCCNECNQSFSLDEEYVACLLECVIHGTTDIDKLKRDKIKNILRRKESLRQKIFKSITETNGQISFNVEIERLKNVILKLAKGHVKYENSTPILEAPTHLEFKPLPIMTQNEINLFLASSELTKSPEVGSRTTQNLLIGTNNVVYSQWITVQPDIYNYCVTTNPLSVRMIIWNYLAAEVIW